MRTTKNLAGNILKKTSDAIQIEVPTLSFIEDDIHFVNVRALDITGYGNTEQEARTSLNVMLNEFFKHAAENKS